MRNSINDDDSFSSRFLNHLPVGSYIDLEDSEDEEEESNLEMVCPYCSEGFDALGLCVHLEDQHPLEIKLGVSSFLTFNFVISLLTVLILIIDFCFVCPLCASNLGKNMISHLIIQHQGVLKISFFLNNLHVCYLLLYQFIGLYIN
ncbi:putative drought induced 19 type, zinc-binding protein [Helianthus anomalus]